MLDKIKKIVFNKKTLIALTIIIVLVIAILFIRNINKITKLERIKIEEKSSEISDYFDEITENKDDEGRYINFAIEYLYNSKNKNTFTVDDILSVIKDNFDIEYDKNKIGELGITSKMHAKGIVFDNSISSFKYDGKRTKADVASDKIIYFKINKIKKVNKNNFKVTYDKYVVEKPFDIYNYYNNYNIEHYDEKKEQFDTKPITDYLKGEGKISTMKKIAREETKKNFGKLDGKIVVSYVIKDDKLLVKNID